MRRGALLLLRTRRLVPAQLLPPVTSLSLVTPSALLDSFREQDEDDEGGAGEEDTPEDAKFAEAVVRFIQVPMA